MIMSKEEMLEMLYKEAVTHYYPLFAAGARLLPSTVGNRAAVQCLLEAWPAIKVAMEAPEKQCTLEKIDNLMKLIMAARVIREELEAGARIVKPETKTPDSAPRG